MKILKNKKIAIYGGSFDPIHIGHILTGYEIIEKLNYDYVLYIPDNIPVHKSLSKSSTSIDRFNMVKMSIKYNDKFLCSDIEIKRGGLSYTYDTVIELKNIYQNENKFGIIFGDDLLNGIHLWKRIDELQEICDLICLKRNNINEKKTGIKTNFISNRIMEISSTEIRDRIEKDLTIYGMVTEPVRNYIIKKKLYRKNNGNL